MSLENLSMEKCPLKLKEIEASKVKDQLPEGITKQQLGYGLQYITVKNQESCIGSTVAEALLAATTAKDLYEDLKRLGIEVEKGKVEKIQQAEDVLRTSNSHKFKYQARFNKLPKAAQEKLKSIEVLKQLRFDALKLLDALHPDS
ncbi:hypothetical protein [Zooshikella sp. RANM57]|uniref:hypothetical protein n=1 Tax=Zooshikella sp. RANM57 TaxID=3425863 RepID=UPI003D6F4AAA